MEMTNLAIGTLIVTEVILAWRIWRLERRMLAVTKHFVAAKDFLGEIRAGLDKYHDVVGHITKNGLDIKVKSERFGELELHIKGTEAL